MSISDGSRVRAFVAGALLLPVLACSDNDTVTAPSPIERRSNQVIVDWNVAVIDVMTAHDQYGEAVPDGTKEARGVASAPLPTKTRIRA